MSQDYIVSARKYRPSTFHSVVGQKSLVQTLKNAIVSGKLAHAYLFCGPRGVGKTTCARIFAKTINCQHLTADGDACNECDSCRSFNEQRSLNIHELDAASNNGVDNIRDLNEQVRIPPQIGKYKVFIIDEVHMLSTAAFNAFLKTLEEPPTHAIFILATTEKQKILPTILSRCQTYDFQRISRQDIVDHLSYVAQQENIHVEQQALQVIAQKADGGMRDALSVFDQIASYTGGNVTYQATTDNLNILDYDTFFRLTDAALGNNVPAALLLLDQSIKRGFDPQIFIGGWGSHLRDVMVSKDPATLPLIEAGQEVALRFQQQAAQCSTAFLYHALQIANECDFNYKNSRNKRLLVEIAIMKICQLTRPIAMPAAQAPTPVTPSSASAVSSAGPSPAVARPTASPAPRPSNYATPATLSATVVSQPSVAYSATPASARPVSTLQAPQDSASSVQSTPQRAVRGSGRTGSSRLRDQLLGNEAVVASESFEQDLPDMNEPVDISELRRHWKEYASTISTEVFLVNTMKTCLPEKIEGNKYEVLVVNEEQKDRFEQKLREIHLYLYKALRNTHIEISVRLAPPESVKQAFTPLEKLMEMKEGNSAIDQLIDTFGLELV